MNNTHLQNLADSACEAANQNYKELWWSMKGDQLVKDARGDPYLIGQAFYDLLESIDEQAVAQALGDSHFENPELKPIVKFAMYYVDKTEPLTELFDGADESQLDRVCHTFCPYCHSAAIALTILSDPDSYITNHKCERCGAHEVSSFAVWYHPDPMMVVRPVTTLAGQVDPLGQLITTQFYNRFSGNAEAFMPSVVRRWFDSLNSTVPEFALPLDMQ